MSESKKEIRNVTVPLSVDQIKEFFTNKEIIYLVNYKNSDLKGVVFLTYLSNLDLPAEIDFSENSFEEKEELFKIYMETRNIIPCDTLRFNAAAFLLEKRGLNSFNYLDKLYFSKEEMKKFIENNLELVNKWEQFVESTTIYAQSTIEPLLDRLNLEEIYPICDDQQFIGANVVNLFSIGGFYELFLSRPFAHQLTYFKPQFQEYMFRGKNFYSFYNCDENTVYKLFLGHVNGTITTEMIHKAQEGALDIQKRING